MTRTIIIGDVHGCGSELLSLLDQLRFPLRGDRLIFVGDLFDRGPSPQVVLQTILEHRRLGPKLGYSIESVCGNHDAELLANCRTLQVSGGDESLVSPAQVDAIRAVKAAGMFDDLSLFLEELATIDTIQDTQKRWAVVHAGIEPELGLDATPKGIKLTIKAFSGMPAWYDEYDGSDGLIICGHQHQAEPLIRRRNGLPVVVNIDTGCCYGNRLTAYVVEEDRFESVPAAKVYFKSKPFYSQLSRLNNASCRSLRC